MTLESAFHDLGLGVVLAPTLLLLLFAVSATIGRPLTERMTSRLTQATVWAGLAMSVAVLVLMLSTGNRNVQIELGDWVVVPGEEFHFHISFEFDRLSVPFVILSFVLLGTIGAFATRYLHRERGYGRFFLLYAMFLQGMVVASLAATIETLFIGWELVGLSSALLVAYFQERPAPVINGMRVWSVYRISDAAFLVAAVALHHMTGHGSFQGLMGQGAWPHGGWPEGVEPLTQMQAMFVGLLLLVAAAGKSGLIPFSGWLPRAMEGPTPSSAVFYGALSVHLGAFLLLRVCPILDESTELSAIVAILGLSTAIFAAITGRVQTDVKSALAFASLTQVGLITFEIGLPISRYIPLVHIIGHACLRTLQLLRAPTLLQDYRTIENAIGGRLPQGSRFAEQWIPERLRMRVYRLSLERGFLDAMIDQYVVRPFVRLFRSCDALERKWTSLLSGVSSRESDRAGAPPTLPEELR
jgi:NAD(P)H-quinone oxidoreductase subunit 5